MGLFRETAVALKAAPLWVAQAERRGPRLAEVGTSPTMLVLWEQEVVALLNWASDPCLFRPAVRCPPSRPLVGMSRLAESHPVAVATLLQLRALSVP